MEQALRNRLTFGPLMLAGLFLLLWLDHAVEHWTVGCIEPQLRGHGLAGTGLLALLLIILPVATLEVGALFTAERLASYRLIAVLGSGSLVVHAFLTQFRGFRPVAASTMAFIVVFVMLLAALRRAMLWPFPLPRSPQTEPRASGPELCGPSSGSGPAQRLKLPHPRATG